MAEQNQTVHTTYTAEANLQAAEAELREFAQKFQSILKAMDTATGQVDAKMLGIIRNFNKAMGTMQQAQRTLQGLGVQPDRMGARNRSDIKSEAASLAGDLAGYRKTVSKALAGTVLEIDDQIKKLDEAFARLSRNRRKNAKEISETQAEIDRLTKSRSTIASNPYVAAELAGARTTKAKGDLRKTAADDRMATRAAEDLTRAKMRLVEIENALAGLDARRGGRIPSQIKILRDEQRELQQLTKAYEALPAVMAKYERNLGKNTGGILKGKDRETVATAREHLRLEERARDIQAQLAQFETGKLRIDQLQLANLRNELRMTEQLLSLHRQDADVMSRVATLRDRATAKQNGADYDAMRRQADRDNKEFDRVRGANNPDRAAGRYLSNERLIANIEVERARLAGQRNQTARTQITLLDQELIRLRAAQAELMKISGIETRIASQRAASAKQERLPDPRRRMGARADLMGDYAALGAASMAAYSVANFAVQDESTLAKFRAIASASGSETAKLNIEMKELGTQTRFTNVQIAEGATLLAQAGLSARDTGPALKSIAMLATAAGVEFRQAADVMTSVGNIWGYNTSQMGATADILTAALNQTKLGMDQMQLGIQYAGNTAVDAGVDFVELTSIMGAMAQAGIRSGSTIGTGLRTLLVDLLNPSEKTVAAMERLGLSMADVDVRSLGLTQVLHNLKSAGFTSADAMGAFEIRAAAAFAAVSNNLDIVDGLQNSLFDTGAAARANAVQMDTLSAKWTVFTNAALALGSKALAPVIAFLKSFLEVATGVIGILNQMTPVVQVATVAITALFAQFAISRLGLAVQALASLIPVFGGIAGAAGAAATATGLVGVAIKALPIIGWLITGVSVVKMLYDWASGSKAAGDGMDELEGRINDLNSEMMENQQAVKAVDDAMGRLRQRQAELERGTKEMRDNVLNQTAQRFEALGLKIKEGENSVDGMIAALGRLRTELNRDFESQLLALADRLQEKIDKMNRTVAEGDGVSDDTKQKVGAALRNQTGRMVLGEDAGKVFGPAGERVYRNILDSSTATPEQLSTDLRSLREGLRMTLDQLRNTPEGRNKDRLQRHYDNLQQLILGGRELQSTLISIGRMTEEQAKADQDARYAGLLADPNSLANQIRTSVTNEMIKFGPRANEIKRSEADVSERARLGKSLRDDADSKLFELQEQINRIFETRDTGKLAEFQQEFLEGILTEQREYLNRTFAFLEPVEAQAQKANRANGRVEGQAVNDEQDIARRLATAERKELEARMDALDAEIARLGAQGGSVEQIQQAYEEWKRLNGQLNGSARAERRAQLETAGSFDRRGGLQMPASGSISSAYSANRRNPVTGEMRPHHGMDIALAQGSRVNAAGSGTVVFAGRQAGYGNTIEIEHANGIRTLYAHLSQILVRKDQEIERGAEIAKSGGAVGTPGAGTSTGAHLHFGVKRNGRWVDPRSVIGGAAGGDNDPAFRRIAALEESEATAAENARADDMARKVSKLINTALWDPLEAAMKSRRDTNNRELDNLVGNLAAVGDATTTLADVTDKVKVRVQDNMLIAERLLTEDPDNAGRLNHPEFRAQVQNEVLQEMLKGADKMDAAYEAFVALQKRLGDDALRSTEQQVRIAGGTVGTSGTTKWLLEQRLELEQYQAALAVVTASELAYTDALARRAEAEAEVARLTLYLRDATAAGNQDAIAKATEALALAEQTLKRVHQTANAAGVRVLQAQQTANAAQPIGPIASGAATATAAGINPFERGADAVTAAIERYKKQSGVMVSAAETVSDAIYGSFEALAGGIEQTINQLADGSLTIKGLFSNIVGGILKEIQQAAAKMAANWIMQMILKMVMQRAMPMPGGSMDAQGMAMLNRPSDWRAQQGGEAPYRRFALGSGQAGRDSVRALLEPGEIVMRKSAVDFIGRENLLDMNRMGNKRLSDAGSKIQLPQPREPDKVNVWVVDRTQVPPPSERDIIHHVGQSIIHGELRKLVKTVAVGG